jgi:hypothetical protein
MGVVGRIQDANLFQSISRGEIPEKALANGGIFASHSFDINPNREIIADPVALKPFSSKFANPMTGDSEQLLVLGLTGSEDGQNHRRKTDFVLVIDCSGSMDEPLVILVPPLAPLAADVQKSHSLSTRQNASSTTLKTMNKSRFADSRRLLMF